MPQIRIPAAFIRGGTSKAIVFHASDLPADTAVRDAIILAAIGSPDPNGRQLDGMGGGMSSLSKICIVGPPSRPDADVDYTFGQVAIAAPKVDYAGNCGNMSSAIGPFAVDEGLVAAPADGEAVVRIHNTNTAKIIVARFPVEGGKAAVDGDWRLDGVAGAGAPVRLEFEAPGGAKTGRLLPTGNAVDRLPVAGLGTVEASLVDAANPCVFVPAEALDCAGTELPDAIGADALLMERLEAIRCAASVAMGLAPSLDDAAAILSVPKVAMVAAPCQAPTLSGRTLAAAEHNIAVRMISVGQPHRAVPLTGALCLAVAARLSGSVVAERLAGAAPGADIVIGHPSGTLTVAAEVREADGVAEAVSATVIRTQRRLFEGAVLVPEARLPTRVRARAEARA
ncbi:2-methylaconitate cis-trans isomerase PrpF family protein [Faunimonas sp. B44]